MYICSLGIGMDSCVIPLRYGGYSLVQTTDFFYPLVEDPYMQGKLWKHICNLRLKWSHVVLLFVGRIACANVLSDLYAMGTSECDNMLMLITIPSNMREKEQNIVIPLIMRGFRDCAKEANVVITGGHTAMNPWLTVGGAATSVCPPNEFIV